MHQYLRDTEFAAKELIEIISSDYQEYQAVFQHYDSKCNESSVLRENFLANELSHNANHFYGQFSRAQLEQEYLMEGLYELEIQISSKQASIDALSGALLQIAKQGISIVHRNIASCPNGRHLTNDLRLKTVVWEGRNQSLHYEDPRGIKIPVDEMFGKLNTVDTSAPDLDPRSGINLSFEVIKVLDWLTYEKYLEDMQVLIPE